MPTLQTMDGAPSFVKPQRKINESREIILFTIVFFGKRKNNTNETFHILKMKAHYEKESHFENENLFSKK